MRRSLILLSILIFATGLVSFAHGRVQEKEGQMGMHDGGIKAGGMCGMHRGHMMHGRMYSMMVHHILIKANSQDLTDTQRKELASIRERYIYPMIRKEADLKISHMRIMGMLHDPNFDPAKVKAEIKTPNEIHIEMANMAIDALADIRNAIGVENFKKIAEMGPMMHGRMMKE